MLVDLHTTNGSYHANHLTYSPILNPNADARLIDFTRDKMLAPIRAAMLKDHNWRTYYYGNFAPEDGGGRESSRVDPANPGNVTWRTFDHRPRFGNNYAGLRNRIAILSEAYSYLDFKGRVEVTEDFVEEIYKSVAANAKQIMTLTAQADRVFGVFAATRSLPMPKGWLIPKTLAESPRLAAALDRLRWHGIKISELAAGRRLLVERFTVAELNKQPRVFQGHQEARAKGSFDKVQLVVNAGSLFIPANQPLARLAFYLIEPESDDGLVT